MPMMDAHYLLKHNTAGQEPGQHQGQRVAGRHPSYRSQCWLSILVVHSDPPCSPSMLATDPGILPCCGQIGEALETKELEVISRSGVPMRMEDLARVSARAADTVVVMWPQDMDVAAAAASQAATLSALKAVGGVTGQKLVVQSTGSAVAEYNAAEVALDMARNGQLAALAAERVVTSGTERICQLTAQVGGAYRGGDGTRVMCQQHRCTEHRVWCEVWAHTQRTHCSDTYAAPTLHTACNHYQGPAHRTEVVFLHTHLCSCCQGGPVVARQGPWVVLLALVSGGCAARAGGCSDGPAGI